MGDDFVPPVKALLKAIDAGSKVAGRLIVSAREAPAARALHISETALRLQSSLERNSQTVAGAYRENVARCGQPFPQTLVEEDAIQERLKLLKIEVRDKIDEIEEDHESFDRVACLDAQEEARKCSATCVEIFDAVRGRILAAQMVHDDRAQLPTMRVNNRSPTLGTTPSPISKVLPTPLPPAPSRFDAPLAISQDPQRHQSIPDDRWTIGSPSLFQSGAPISSAAASAHQRRQPSWDISPSSLPDGNPRLISRDTVRCRVDANEEFLERRRQSKLSFLNEIRKSVSSLDDAREHDICQAQRHDSQDSIFGLRAAAAPISPPLNEYRALDESDTWGTLGGALATTLQTPDFGKGVEPGLEVVTGIDYENEKIAVGPDEYRQPTPSSSVKSIDYPIRHDASFYKFGGFCEGSKAVLRGENGFRVVKRPSGHYSATVSARCVKCSYEVGWNDVEKDRLLERSGIYGNCGIRWRQRFISKCHVKTNSVEEPIYACIFCIDEHKTIEEHDATVFFSVPQLFKHLAKHPRPLPAIPGITILYGFVLPEVVDFDIHFTTAQATASAYSTAAIAHKIATRPSGQGTSTHHPKNVRSSSRDPEGHPVLKFANGARIVGITFPERFGGKWCIGYHDGERGAFPASEIMLEMPGKEDVLMNPQSSLVAIARWDFKPKDLKDGGWLRLSKGERIGCIGFTYQDQWCWSGQNGKGKWGLFPAVFVEDLQDAGEMGTSPKLSSSAGKSGFGLIGRMPSFPLSRRKSVKQQAGSRSSNESSGGAGGVGGVGQQQAGLEVVR